MSEIRVAIVEDDSQLREDWAFILSQSDGISCIGSFATAESFLESLGVPYKSSTAKPQGREKFFSNEKKQPPGEKPRFTGSSEPGIVLMDIDLPGMNGIECVRLLKSAFPNIQVIILTVFREQELVFDALAAGAIGYLLKSSTPIRLAEVLHEVAAGGSPMSGAIARQVIEYFRRNESARTGDPCNTAEKEKLTGQEFRVVEKLATGKLYKEIADELDISLDTVRTHIRHVYEKLQVHTRFDAVNKIFPK